MKKTALSLLIFIYSFSAQADELYKYTNVLCMKEINTLWITALNLYNTQPPDWDEILKAKNIKNAPAQHTEVLQSKYNVYSSDVTNSCELNGIVYKTTINYESPRASGTCGSCEPGHLTIARNGKVILRDIPFNTTYIGSPSVLQVIIKSGREDEDVKILAYPDGLNNDEAQNVLAIQKTINKLSEPITKDVLYNTPSFDCAKVSDDVEKIICQNSELSELDKKMAQNFQIVKKNLSPEKQAQLLDEQRKWLKSRELNCYIKDASGKKINKQCLINEYNKRNVQLLNKQ